MILEGSMEGINTSSGVCGGVNKGSKNTGVLIYNGGGVRFGVSGGVARTSEKIGEFRTKGGGSLRVRGN